MCVNKIFIKFTYFIYVESNIWSNFIDCIYFELFRILKVDLVNTQVSNIKIWSLHEPILDDENLSVGQGQMVSILDVDWI